MKVNGSMMSSTVMVNLIIPTGRRLLGFGKTIGLMAWQESKRVGEDGMRSYIKMTC